ncbi:MAG TPA: tetratricopeptide repeat protein [Terriglobales bacterium]|nr:tetratricopeptide repeat protein [Terriglobales bacterium]
MSSRRWNAIFFVLLLIACMAGSVFFLQRVDQLRSGATLGEVLYISSPKVLKRLSLGYSGLLADIYWTRAVQYFGGKHHEGAEHFDLLAPLLEITTTLDPQLVVAYQYGANFLAPKPPNGAGQPQRAIDLVEFGIRHNPNDWKLYYEEGFIYYTELKDYARAANAFARGSRVPNAHPFLKLLAGRMAEQAGSIETARLMWTAAYQTTQDKAIRANALAHLRALQVDEDVTTLEGLAARYKDQTGQFPSSFSQMESAGFMRGVPLDPLGRPYRLLPDGRVQVVSPDDFPFIERGTPPGYKPPATPKFLPSD